jgi:hypothetical protein
MAEPTCVTVTTDVYITSILAPYPLDWSVADQLGSTLGEQRVARIERLTTQDEAAAHRKRRSNHADY